MQAVLDSMVMLGTEFFLLSFIGNKTMKLKLAFLGLLALAPLAAQAELVEMQDTELSGVNGQGFSWSGTVNAGWSGTVAGYDVQKSVSIFKDEYCPEWAVEGETTVSSLYSGRWATKSLVVGNDHGVKYVNPYFSWGRYQYS